MDLAGRFGLLLIFSGLGLAYSLYVWLVAWLLIPSWRGRPARSLWLAVLASLIVIAGGIAAYEALAWYFRHDPAGFGGLQRTGEARDTFAFWARTAFFVLYGLFVVIAGGLGYVAGRFRGSREGSTAVATLLTASLFLVLTIRIVDYENSCYVGESFILDLHCG